MAEPRRADLEIMAWLLMSECGLGCVSESNITEDRGERAGIKT